MIVSSPPPPIARSPDPAWPHFPRPAADIGVSARDRCDYGDLHALSPPPLSLYPLGRADAELPVDLGTWKPSSSRPRSSQSQSPWHRPLPLLPICIVRPCKLPATPAVGIAWPSNARLSACLRCRAAKVRCLISQRQDRCDRCATNNTECVFAQPKRARARTHPYPRHLRRPSSPQQGPVREPVLVPSPSPSSSPSSSPSLSGPQVLRSPTTSGPGQDPPITVEIRARIIATLATLNGKRGAPFSFVTSGDTPPFGVTPGPDSSQQEASDQPQPPPSSLKLSWLLRPLTVGSRAQAGDDDRQPSSQAVKMPSYASSMTLGQTITDPIEDGILSRAASVSLFNHFMIEMNAKWEYILDPHVDTHDDVRRRSRLLLATVLFCASKFASYVDGCLVSWTADPFLQSRLCSLARCLAVRTFAEGDQSIETMQAFYLLVCWKDAEDDISYLHSGYAFRILHDMDMEQANCDRRQAVRRRRTWLALFRQDKQQSLFFMRRATLSSGDEGDAPFVGDLNTWLKMPHALPLDFVACCSADLRRIQSKLLAMIRKAPSTMLPCLLELMDSDLNRWKWIWQNHLEGEGRVHPNDDSSLDPRLLHPGKGHLTALVGLWEDGIRLNVSSAILRQSLVAAVTSLRSSEQPPPSSLGLDLPSVGEVLSSDITGLASSIQGAFGTLRHLLSFPSDDLRRSPDSVLLLGPNAALFLCLLLCLPCNGILGPPFQKTAIGLIQDVARHVCQSVRSSQDTLALHAAYLNSLVDLLGPATPQWPADTNAMMRLSSFEPSQSQQMHTGGVHVDETAIRAAQVLAGGMGGLNSNVDVNDASFGVMAEPEQMLHMQSLANLLDTSFFWETSHMAMDANMTLDPQLG